MNPPRKKSTKAMENNTFVDHLTALRKTLISCVIATALLYPLCFYLSPHAINALVRWSFPESMGALHYFSPMEVFVVQLKMALALSLALAFPWNIFQLWRFLLPALHRNERRILGGWIVASTVLFLGGIAFCIGFIIPLLMTFSASFATPELRPILGISHFLQLTGWLSLAFGAMFQAPVIVLFLVRFGILSADALRQKRPYVIVAIFIVATLITPPDVISQIALAIPSWLLFELGLLFAKKIM